MIWWFAIVYSCPTFHFLIGLGSHPDLPKGPFTQLCPKVHCVEKGCGRIVGEQEAIGGCKCYYPGAIKTPPHGGENARVVVWVESAGWLVGRMMLARW